MSKVHRSILKASQEPEQATYLILNLLRQKTLPEAITALPHLSTLELTVGPLFDLAQALVLLKKCGKLRELRFNNGEVRRLPKELGGLTQLRRLDLWCCAFEEIPAALFSLTSLEVLAFCRA